MIPKIPDDITEDKKSGVVDLEILRILRILILRVEAEILMRSIVAINNQG